MKSGFQVFDKPSEMLKTDEVNCVHIVIRLWSFIRQYLAIEVESFKATNISHQDKEPNYKHIYEKNWSK